jgi:integrase/recombinase XerC
MTAAVPTGHGSLAPRPLETERLIERWREGRSPQTLRAYSNDLRHFAGWLSTAQAVMALLGKPQGEANEIVRAYRSAMSDQGLSPGTINRRLSALRSLVALGRRLQKIRRHTSSPMYTHVQPTNGWARRAALS